MTRKHFQLIADVIETYQFTDEQDRRILASRMADALYSTNPNFDRYRFLAACGVK